MVGGRGGGHQVSGWEGARKGGKGSGAGSRGGRWRVTGSLDKHPVRERGGMARCCTMGRPQGHGKLAG